MIRLLLCLSLIFFSESLGENCKKINWLEHSADISGFTGYLASLTEDPQVQALLKKEDPHTVPGNLLEKMRFTVTKKIIYDYKLDLQMKHFKLAGFSTFKFSPATILSNGDIKLTMNFDKLDLEGRAEADIHQLTQSGCTSTEEEYLGLCYRKCSLLAGSSYPKRTATNTCSKNGCASQGKENNAGLCYPWCKAKYKGVGPVCWAICSEWYGNDYKDTGLTCHRWWPPHSKSKPSYGRGVGTLPYAPWTKGLGCNGFGISTGGGCAYPYWRICLLDGLKLKPPGQCGPQKAYGNVDFKLIKPRIDIVMNLDAPECTDPATPGEDVSPKIACIIKSLLYAVMGAMDPSAAQASIDHLNQLKSKMSRVTFKSLNLHYESGSQTDFDFSTSGLLGWLVDTFKGQIKGALSDHNTMKSLLNDQLLNKFVKDAVNVAIDKTLANNQCRS